MSDEETNQLAELEKNVKLDKYDDTNFEMVASSSKFLPRLQLCTSRTEAVEDGLISANHYGIVKGKKNIVDAGEEVDCLVVSWRPKALELGAETVSCYDPAHPEFQRIQERADNEKESGCMYGPEFLLWLPECSEFVTFFMGSISSRNEAKSLKALMRNSATLKSQKIETKKYKWFAPLCVPHNLPISPMPGAGQFEKVVNTFLNPTVSVEKASDEDESDEAGRDR